MAEVGKAQHSAIQILRGQGEYPSYLVHGFSTRAGGSSTFYGGGSLNLGFTHDDRRETVEHNRAVFLEALGCSNGRGEVWPLVTLRQIHSDLIHTIRHLPQRVLTGDGLITSTPGLLLAVETADCLPVLLADTKLKVVGAFHAGWRGTLARIVEKGVGAMQRDFSSNSCDVHAIIGPGIRACCYAVGDELFDKFQSQFSYGRELFHEVVESDPVRDKYPLMFLNARTPGRGGDGHRLHLDLVAANLRQLRDAGVSQQNISTIAMCTACCPDLFFSYRAAKGPTGRQMGVVGIRSI